MSQPQVVVTGIGVVSSLGIGVSAFLQSLRAGRTGFAPIDRFDTSKRQCHCAALVRGFDPSKFIEPNRMRRMDPLSIQAVSSARMALQDAGIEATAPDAQNGVVFGTAYGCQATTLRYASKLIEQGARYTNPIDFPDSIDGAPAAHIAMELGFQGPSTTLVDGAVAGETALIQASLMLHSGRAKRMLVVAGEQLTPVIHGVLDDLGTLCLPDAQGEERMCPYDQQCRGPVPGEGMAALVLETLESASSRGAKPYAQVLGFSHVSDSRCQPHRFSKDIGVPIAALQSALGRAQLGAQQLDLFSGAAASVLGLDNIELEAASNVLSHASAQLFALKSSIGDFEASGVVRLAAGCLALAHELLPATHNLHHPLVPTHLGWSREPKPYRAQTLLHHGMGRGGQSLAIVLGRL